MDCGHPQKRGIHEEPSQVKKHAKLPFPIPKQRPRHHNREVQHRRRGLCWKIRGELKEVHHRLLRQDQEAE